MLFQLFGRDGVAGRAAGDVEAIVVARQEEIGIGAEQRFQRDVAFLGHGDLRQFFAVFGRDLVFRAGESRIAHEFVFEAEREHQLDDVAVAALGSFFEDDFAVAVIDRCVVDRFRRAHGRGGKRGAQQRRKNGAKRFSHRKTSDSVKTINTIS